MRSVLPREFFNRPTPKVARELLGKFLVRKTEDGEVAYMITEVEAYDGFHDKASHAARGETKRNAPMWGDAGRWYVYFVYGMYEMLNIVTREKGYPGAVLIRAVEGISGPGRLTKKLKIARALSGEKAARSSGVWIEDRGVRVSPKHVTRAARIGVAYAGTRWSSKPWRFVLEGTRVLPAQHL